MWDCLVVTCPPDGRALALQKETELLRSRGWLDLDLPVLTAEDPAPAAGSGTATLNALLVAAEFLSLRQGYSVVTADVFGQSRVLVLHHGRTYLWECRGKAFVDLARTPPEEEESGRVYSLDNCLRRLLWLMEKVSRDEESGVWVCSTDALLLSSSPGPTPSGSSSASCDAKFLTEWEAEETKNKADIKLFYISAGAEYAAGHGVVRMDSQVSLFFDILVAAAADVGRDDFLSGRCGRTYDGRFGLERRNRRVAAGARSVVWDGLSPYRMAAVGLKNYAHFYWSDEETGRRHLELLRGVATEKVVHSHLEEEETAAEDCLVLNSWLSAGPEARISTGSAVYNCRIQARDLKVGSRCFLNGSTLDRLQARIVVPDGMAVLGLAIRPPDRSASSVRLHVVSGCDDIFTVPFSDRRGTFCNRPWNRFFQRTGIGPDDLWDPDLGDDRKTLLRAKLYWTADDFSEHLLLFTGEETWNKDQYLGWKNRKRFSINDILKFNDYEEAFQSRRELYASIALKEISKILLNNSDSPVLPYFRTAHVEGWDKRVVNVLDEVCLKSASKTEILSRTLSCIADLLGIMAGKLGGVRSGPGNNRLWISAFNLLQEGKIEAGLQALKDIRDQWLDHPHRIIRAARHYESALQILIRKAVTTANQFVQLSKVPLLPFNQYVVVECPARVDLQGGWSDTPPICYELGGSVVNVAVLIDGKKPIGAKACRIPDLEIIMNLGENESAPTLTINHVDQLLDYNQPNAEAALLKAAVVYVGLVEVESEVPLSQQLRSKYEGGFRIAAWSLLPRGSGMGTSSIMASAILAALWTVTGRSYCHESLIHAVLQLEQLLTTGGGWQDQVGGIVGGIKRGLSEPGLPLRVLVEEAQISEEFLKRFEDHFLLIYTGKVRLAKNLLQNVIRNWYAREQKVVHCFHSLLQNSSRMFEAFHSGDLEKIGHLMNVYWEQKQWLAPGSRPDLVGNMTDKLQSLAYGQCLVGAGGGGFLCLLTKRPHQADTIKGIISQIKGTEKVEIWRVSVCQSGMETRLEPTRI
ncbi:L-fucose kinase-like isoform X3 [Centruroides sculpturatus]|uniref:L-fucose kinase-like isoform X3 n=1 Tax=Centruroides sculpturatus TaxID=218467 RepID=UPI000C6CE655|nr:L-fucose kinase-like isoform X3 [Centruroides sculpturatus]